VFNRDYKAQLRGRWTVLQEQYSWWGQGEPDRRSTLNAVLARKYDEGGDKDLLHWDDAVAVLSAVMLCSKSHTGWHSNVHHLESMCCALVVQ
jgi:hypothetical protein